MVFFFPSQLIHFGFLKITFIYFNFVKGHFSCVNATSRSDVVIARYRFITLVNMKLEHKLCLFVIKFI